MQGTESEEKSDGRTAADFCMQRRGWGAGGRELGQAFLVMKLSLAYCSPSPETVLSP